MTETTLKVQLGELTTIRVLCRKGDCAGVIELPVAQLTKLAKDSAVCPVCREELIFDPDGRGDPLPELGRLLKRLQSLEPTLLIEFPVKIQGL